MPARKPISKSTRFEVFKRDAFTCQYCGKKAPDVILHLEHINPVAGGGGNEIMNLLTACVDCNLGKGARRLDDNTAIAKQRAQLDELNERREQLEMILAWREGLVQIDDLKIDAFNAEFEKTTNSSLNEFGRATVRKWLKKHHLNALLDALQSALDTYYKTGSTDHEENNRLAGVAFNMTVRVIASQQKYAGKPHMKDLFYVRAIVRNRHNCIDYMAIQLL